MNTVPRLVCTAVQHHVHTGRNEGSTCGSIISDKEGDKKCTGILYFSKGYLFQKEKGYSKTAKRNMQKQGLDLTNSDEAITRYKTIRKARKKADQKKTRDKHSLAKANRKEKVKTKK